MLIFRRSFTCNTPASLISAVFGAPGHDLVGKTRRIEFWILSMQKQQKGAYRVPDQSFEIDCILNHLDDEIKTGTDKKVYISIKLSSLILE